MTLQTPVRPVRLNRLQPLAQYRMLAPFVVIGVLLWQPQRLARFEVEGTQTQLLQRLPSRNTRRAWGNWFAIRPRQGDLTMICSISLLMLNIVISSLCWVVATQSVPGAHGDNRIELLLCGIFWSIAASEAMFIATLVYLVEVRSVLLKPVGSAFVTSIFAGIVVATGWIGIRVIQEAGGQVLVSSPIWYGMIVALLYGIWVGVAYAYFDSIEHNTRVLLVEIGLAGVAFGGLTTGFFFLLGRVTPVLSWAEVVAVLALSMLLAGGAYAVGILRPDQWFVRIVTGRRFSINLDERSVIPAVTPLPTNALSNLLEDWLDADPWLGLENVWTVWDNTRQSATVGQVVRDRLARQTDVDASFRSVTLMIDQRINSRRAMTPSDWSIFFGERPDPPMLGFIRLPSLRGSRKGQEQASNTPSIRRQKLRGQRWVASSSIRFPLKSLPTKAPYQAIATVFWYLQYGYVSDALKVLNGIPGGGNELRELRQIASALEKLWNVEGITRTSPPTLPVPPTPSMWPGTWLALENLVEVCQLGWLYLRLSDANQRAWCMQKANDLLQTNRQMASARAQTPPAGSLFLSSRTGWIESRFLRRLTREWSDALRSWQGFPSIPAVRLPVASPFQVTEPIPASRSTPLIGRDIDLTQLVSTWTTGSLRSTLLVGQPLIGKTSIVNAAIRKIGANTTVITVKIDYPSAIHPSATLLLFSICERVCNEAGATMPGREDPLWLADPYEQFQFCFADAMRQLSSRCAVIVVDGLDAIESAAPVPDVLKDCLEFLLHLSRSYPQVVFTFVTQLPRAYWERTPNHPLIRHCIVLNVGTLSTFSPIQTRQQVQVELANRLINVPLRSENVRLQDDALQHLFDVTDGHPYLMAALAHGVLVDYNWRIGTSQPSFLLTVADIESARRQAPFVTSLRRYGEEVIGALERLFPPGRRDFVVPVLMDIAGRRKPIPLSTMDRRFPPAVAGNPSSAELDLLLVCMGQLGLVVWVNRHKVWFFYPKVGLFWEWLSTR